MRMSNSKTINGKKQGSVLVFALIILSIMLMSGLAIVATTITAMKGSASSDKSVQAFQLAESGMEIALKDFKDVSDGSLPADYTIGDIGKSSDSACGGDECSATCSDSTLKIKLFKPEPENPNIEMTFTDSDGMKLACDAPILESAVPLVFRVKEIKSVGTFQGVSRAIGTGISKS